MSTRQIIEPLALAARGRTLEGHMPLASLARLLPLLAGTDPQGEVEYQLEFGADEGGNPRIIGSVTATLPLVCQRCMESMVHSVTTRTRLGIVSSQRAAEQLPERYEPLLVPAEEQGELGAGELPLATLIEDELILALPQVAMHRTEECPRGEAFLGSAPDGDEDGSVAQRENPFAVLAQLKSTPSEQND
ncbi:MAG TPA: hypothetical protein ENI97_03770 [Gammaproteobacteria bacterium]|nr:hypothetical protein [Gammaproteobacteria bacterium]